MREGQVFLMNVLSAAEILERIALVAKLSSGRECRHKEREVAVIWIAKMAGEAMEKLASTDDDSMKKTDIFH